MIGGRSLSSEILDAVRCANESCALRCSLPRALDAAFGWWPGWEHELVGYLCRRCGQATYLRFEGGIVHYGAFDAVSHHFKALGILNDYVKNRRAQSFFGRPYLRIEFGGRKWKVKKALG